MGTDEVTESKYQLKWENGTATGEGSCYIYHIKKQYDNVWCMYAEWIKFDWMPMQYIGSADSEEGAKRFAEEFHRYMCDSAGKRTQKEG